MRKGLIALLIPFSIVFSSCSSGDNDKIRLITNVYDGQKETIFFSHGFKLDNYLTIKEEDLKMAKTGMVFASSMSSEAAIDFESDNSEPKFDPSVLARHFNLDDFEYYFDKDFDVDENDINAISMCHKKYKGTEICFVVLMESEGTKTWFSNFDVGCDDASYYDKTGEHPEWTNKSNHKGFDVAANRCLTKLKDYISRKLDANCPQIFHLFGHSRGGAISNVMAAKMVDEDYLLTCHSYASPRVTTDITAKDSKYKNFYVYNCKEDVVTSMPLEDWGFVHYGNVTTFSMRECKDNFKKMNGFGIPIGSSSPAIKVLGSLTDSRENFYKCSDRLLVASSDPIKEEEVNDFIDKYINKLQGPFSPLNKFVEINVLPVEDSDLFIAQILTCAGFYSESLAMLVSYGFYGQGKNPITELSDYFNILLDISDVSLAMLTSINILYFVSSHYYYSFVGYLC